VKFPREETVRRVNIVRELFRRGAVQEVGVLYDWRHPDELVIAVCIDKQLGISFRFDDMPKIAEALGTERIDFRAERGSQICDSVTFDGCNVLHIYARYA
jgi:hypothetical protein